VFATAYRRSVFATAYRRSVLVAVSRVVASLRRPHFASVAAERREVVVDNCDAGRFEPRRRRSSRTKSPRAGDCDRTSRRRSTLGDSIHDCSLLLTSRTRSGSSTFDFGSTMRSTE
jgi:hypothetical protein